MLSGSAIDAVDSELIDTSSNTKSTEAAAAALAASVAFFRRAAPRRRESLTPARPRGDLEKLMSGSNK